jgi:hypothetical protein
MPAKQERYEAIARRLQKQGRAGPRKKIEGGEYVKGLLEGGKPTLFHKQAGETADASALRKSALKGALASKGTADTKAKKLAMVKKNWGMKK